MYKPKINYFENIELWIDAGKPINSLICGDNMDLLKKIAEDKDYKLPDLLLTDPPYGIGISKKTSYKPNAITTYTKKKWDDEIPRDAYFEYARMLTENQIIFGGNYFADKLKNSKGWIVWDKMQPEGVNWSSAELIYTSFDRAVKTIRMHHGGNTVSNNLEKAKARAKIHQSQKPVKLIRWILQNYVTPGNLVLDTHSGSASIAIACWEEGYNFIAIEKDVDHYLASVKRFKQITEQGMLF